MNYNKYILVKYGVSNIFIRVNSCCLTINFPFTFSLMTDNIKKTKTSLLKTLIRNMKKSQDFLSNFLFVKIKKIFKLKLRLKIMFFSSLRIRIKDHRKNT